jgi:poly-gamma-glutamate synthesis protein (capsule biosynthesis protein)
MVLAIVSIVVLSAVPVSSLAAEEQQVTLLFTGDVLPHTPVVTNAARNAGGEGHDFFPMFRDVAPVVSAVDLAVCHLEVSLGVPGVTSSAFPRLAAPAALADGLAAAGFEACSTASNHSFDFGEAGVVSTIASLDGAGLAHTGTATGPAHMNGIVFSLDQLSIGHASYTYWLNGLNLPADKPWLANLVDPERILADAARLKRVGADFVVISLHWGIEYTVEPRAAEMELAELLIASPDIDLIIGHHAHVVQPVAWFGDEAVAFGLGNFLSNQSRVGTQDGVMLLVRLEEKDEAWVTAEVAAIPTWVDRRNGHVIRSALSRPSLQVSADRTGQALNLRGAGLPLMTVVEARRWVLGPHLTARLQSLCAPGPC